MTTARHTRLFVRLAGALAALVLLSSCQPANIAPDKLSSIRRVVVLSLVGHELSRTYIGLTVFGNEREKHDIRSWGLDSALEAQAAAALGKVASFEAVPAVVDRDAFMPLYGTRTGPINPDLLEPGWASIAGPLRDLAARSRADVILVVLTAYGPEPLGRDPTSISGLGVYARGPFAPNMAVAHIFAGLYAVDPGTLKTLARTSLWNRKLYPNGTWDDIPMWERIDGGIARTPFPQWNEAQKAQVREQILKVADRSWDNSLKSLLFGR